MNAWRRLPIRVRLALLFVPGMALTLVAVAALGIARANHDLLDAIDAGLRSRAEVVAAEVHAHGPVLAETRADLIESDEAFVQVVTRSGTVVQSSAIVAGQSLLPPAVAAGVTGPVFVQRRMRGIDGTTRVLAVPVTGPSGEWIIAVGASLQDRADQIADLTRSFAVALPVGIVLASLVGWWLTGAALRPVERMRREAATIATAGLAGRLAPGPAGDELSRLGHTLNAMLDRVEAAVRREQRLVDDASHELRTPLAILRTELDLALSRPRPAAELTEALRNASGETDHLIRIAEDLLVLARARPGTLPVRREAVPVAGLLAEIVERHRSRAASAGVDVGLDAGPEVAEVDPVRIRQAVDDLLDNAIRHSPPGGRIEVTSRADDGRLTIGVADQGGGFDPAIAGTAFEPFVGGGEDGGGAGLGLAIVRVIAEAHGGTVTAINTGGGACVEMVLPATGFMLPSPPPAEAAP